MPVREHVVSYRNGPQVMVAGLRLRDMGYGYGAHVHVTDPTANPANVSWGFVVSNNEHATLVSRNPAPPAWVQPGVRIRIGVRSPVSVAKPLAMINAANRWNTFEITAKGPRLIVRLNGTLTVDVENKKFARGPFTLQGSAGTAEACRSGSTSVHPMDELRRPSGDLE